MHGVTMKLFQQLFNNRVTIVQQSFNYLLIIVIKSFNILLTIVQQLSNSRSTIVQKLCNNRLTFVQQSFNSSLTKLNICYTIFKRFLNSVKKRISEIFKDKCLYIVCWLILGDFLLTWGHSIFNPK